MVYMLLGTGFEETEAVTPLDLLRRAGLEAVTVGLNGKTIRSSHGIEIAADMEIGEMDLTSLDMIILPGGLGGVNSIKACPQALEVVRFAWENEKYVAAICAAPTILAGLGITDGREVTCYPGFEAQMGTALCREAAVVVSGRLITGASAGCSIPFGLKLIEVLKGRQAAEKIAKQIVIR